MENSNDINNTTIENNNTVESEVKPKKRKIYSI